MTTNEPFMMDMEPKTAEEFEHLIKAAQLLKQEYRVKIMTDLASNDAALVAAIKAAYSFFNDRL